MDSKGYYKILGVSEKATEDEIKTAFRRLSITYHPDKQAGKSDAEKAAAEKKFKEINEAYQVLSDEKKRKEYDSPYGGFGSGVNWGDGNVGGFNFSSDFGSVFESIFGDRRNNRRYSSREYADSNNGGQYYRPIIHGTDVRLNVNLSLEDIFNGCTKTFKYKRQVRCSNCHGEKGIGNKKTCQHCHGTGAVMVEQMTAFGIFRNQEPCQHCGGKGYTYETKCPTCGGTGFQTEEHTVTVQFKPGTRPFTKIIRAEEGNESIDSRGNNGNCIIIVNYAYDANKYYVDGLDVTEQIYIPYYDALLGCDYILSLPNGTKKKINIMTCIPNKKMLQLTGVGINTDTAKGNYFLQINYVYPQELDPEERKKLEDIKVLYYKKENEQDEGK